MGVLNKCDACGKPYLLKKVCPSCGHVNTSTVSSLRVNEQEIMMNEIQKQNLKKQNEMMKDYEKQMSKMKTPAAPAPQGGGGVEPNPLKFFGILVVIAVLCFLFLKIQILGVSGWIFGNVPGLPGFADDNILGISILDWVIIFVVATAGAGLLSPMSLPAIGILIAFIVIFILFIWPIMKDLLEPVLDEFLKTFSQIPGFGDPNGGGGGSSDTADDIFNYRLEKDPNSDTDWKLIITKNINDNVWLQINSAKLSDGSSLLISADKCDKETACRFEVNDNEEIVRLKHNGDIQDKSYQVSVMMSFDFSGSKAVNFCFIKDDDRSCTDTGSEAEGPVDIIFNYPGERKVDSSDETVDVDYTITLKNRRKPWDEDSRGIYGRAQISELRFSVGEDYKSGDCDFKGDKFNVNREYQLGYGLDSQIAIDCDITYDVPVITGSLKTTQSNFKVDYKYNVIITEKFSKSSGDDPDTPSDGDKSRITGHVSKYETYKTTIQIAIEDEGIDNYMPMKNAVSLVSGVITAESGWKQDTTCKSSWGCGIMQITENTAKSCEDIGSWPEMRSSADKNIRCGVRILKGKMGAMNSVNGNNGFENHIKLTAASYNGGQFAIKKAIEESGDSKWENIKIGDLAVANREYNVCLSPESVSSCVPNGYDCYECKGHVIQKYVEKVYRNYADWLDYFNDEGI